MPSMILDAGGNAVHVGTLTAIMLGGSGFFQLLFVPYLNNSKFKKKYLIAAINIRVLSLSGIAALLFYSIFLKGNLVIGLIFLLITLFSLSGAFANISYTDIFGKSIIPEARKSFLSIKQVVAGIGIILSAYFAKNILTGFSYPDNYSFMFLLAAIVLVVASLGFWKIKEVVPSGFSIKNFNEYKLAIKSELINNNKLKHYLAFINTVGICIAILPFILLYGKTKINYGSLETGNFLLFKVGGVVLAGVVLSVLSTVIRYKYLMYFTALLSLLIPFIVIITNGLVSFYIAFIIGGIVFSMYSISMKGVLLEISDNTNRALYTGIAGAGSIIPILFSLSGGLIIQHFGFTLFFSVFILIILSSLYFVYKLNCMQ